ncbi:hypothetical protein VPNG_07112 [Cytospora leucostoma]|uniref:Cupin type-2 domain-containing protein n=1 Tax=Cytospora leucostoma TaxID=1230097 RepID=A0A423WVB3_9PEZI|nr:hypothetical protein VPNG_07112 [Cytospora leucostoma]
MPQQDQKSARPVQLCRADEVHTGHGQTEGMIRQSAIVDKSPSLCGTLMRAQPHSSSAVHHHGAQDTIVYAVSGAGAIVSLDEEGNEQKQVLKPGDWALIPANREHQEVNDGDEEVVWVIAAPPTSDATSAAEYTPYAPAELASNMAQNSEQDLSHLAPGDELPPPEPVNPDKLTATCHCGRISVEMPTHPSKVNECQCTICYRYGALWSYFPQDDVNIYVNITKPASPSEGISKAQESTGSSQGPDGRSGLKSYVRSDGDGRIGFFFCEHCGCMTHWAMTGKGLAYLREKAEKKGRDASKPETGVNCRMLPPRLLEGVERSMDMVGHF